MTMRWLSIWGGLQADGLGDAQSGGVTSGQNGAVLGAGHATEKVQDLLRAEDDGQFLGFLGGGDDLGQGPILVEGNFVQEAKSGHGDEDGTRSELLCVGQVELVRAYFLRA